MADNVRLGKEEGEALRREGDGDVDDGYDTGEGGGEGEVDMEGRRERGLLSGPRHSN